DDHGGLAEVRILGIERANQERDGRLPDPCQGLGGLRPQRQVAVVQDGEQGGQGACHTAPQGAHDADGGEALLRAPLLQRSQERLNLLALVVGIHWLAPPTPAALTPRAPGERSWAPVIAHVAPLWLPESLVDEREQLWVIGFQLFARVDVIVLAIGRVVAVEI